MTSTAGEYRHNHYVPEWYQRRFMEPGQTRYFRLDLEPDVMRSPSGHKYTRHDLHQWSPERIFAENDLYTTQWGSITSTEIEQFFFGKHDSDGPKALDYFTAFEHPSANGKAFQTFLRYMSVQKLRTPKGLAWLEHQLGNDKQKNLTLLSLRRIQDIFCAMWTECVWQIADASSSPTKFIISDHPVTVYNRACPPLSQYCLGFNDPDIRMAASHTIFPLSLDKILILTNLNWARDPYQNELKIRPNPTFFRSAMFKFTEIQVGRALSEDEVLMINWIIKRRAFRYIAAAQKDWLYPERRVSSLHWKRLGDGYLLMPEPRLLHMGGEIVIGYDDGKSDWFSEYGHKPWQKDYKNEARERREAEALERFKAEWAFLRGARYTAEDYSWMRQRRGFDDDKDMARHRARLKRYRRT
ncbi:MAG: DUF4238 domain-containing protein [Bradyrhizobium sp.]|uniref:DUF4238 domain-containing protein n=1 Tax=Bradyrhizobium sp. TaxID=376 RepID=UPI003BF31FCF